MTIKDVEKAQELVRLVKAYKAQRDQLAGAYLVNRRGDHLRKWGFGECSSPYDYSVPDPVEVPEGLIKEFADRLMEYVTAELEKAEKELKAL